VSFIVRLTSLFPSSVCLLLSGKGEIKLGFYTSKSSLPLVQLGVHTSDLPEIAAFKGSKPTTQIRKFQITLGQCGSGGCQLLLLRRISSSGFNRRVIGPEIAMRPQICILRFQYILGRQARRPKAAG
jgi:hypothetical protein